MQQLAFDWGMDDQVTLLEHPHANRQITLKQHKVLYLLQRRRRKTVGLNISEHGLEVSAPNRASLAEIETIIRNKSLWIVRHLQAGAQQAHSARLQRPVWQDGVYLPWQDGLLQVRFALNVENAISMPLTPRACSKILQSAQLQQQADIKQNIESKATHVLWLNVPANVDGNSLRVLVQSWMQQQAVKIFTQRLDYYAPLLKVQYKKLNISSAKTCWGSANSRGTIGLHWRLLQMPSAALDYVVVHELSHLHEMNHDKRFWSWVESILPDYRVRKQLLKNTQLPPW